ncbi:MAG: type II toxin-antitoxin system Phd/YefM family antitoxin [Alphaproteobacteria bacterium]|nr:MAG: type II toxin-antitoxin system Phd/YefM family antitoxin [Alphaproteobacteria bacterium]
MRTVSIAEAKAHLSKLVDQAEAGDPVCITRRGKPVAQIVAAERKRKPIDTAALRALTQGMTPQKESAGEFMRRLRDTDRY